MIAFCAPNSLLTFHAAFRLKVRNEFLDAQASQTEAKFLENIALVNDMTDILRRNIVQATVSDRGNFRELSIFWQCYQLIASLELKFRPETELGNNEDIKKGGTSVYPCHRMYEADWILHSCQ